jgi:hypothetical protein
MSEFESDLVPATTIPTGTPDLLDSWFEQEATDQDWADWLESIFDPDGPFSLEFITW